MIAIRTVPGALTDRWVALRSESPRRRRPPWPAWFLPVFAAVLLVQGALLALIIPPLQSPDEPAHLSNLILVANAGRPVSEAERDPRLEAAIVQWMERVHYWYYRWEPVPDPLPERLDAGIRPPLYYLIVSAVAAPSRPDTPLEWLYWGRLVSVLLTVATSCLVFCAAHALYPRDPFVPVVTAAFVGFFPMQAYLGASASSDNLANFLAAALFYLAARSLRGGISHARAAGILAVLIGSFGIVGVSGFLAKLTTLFLIVPALALAPLVVWARRPAAPGQDIRRRLALSAGLGLPIGLVGVAAIGGSVLSYLRHRVLYPGTLEAIAALDPTRDALWIGLGDYWGRVHNQFLGNFGWLTIELRPELYLAADLVLLLGTIGLAIAAGRAIRQGLSRKRLLQHSDDVQLNRARQAFIILLGIWIAASLGPLLVLYGMSAETGGGVQGRYLLPDLAPLAVLLALGWRSLLPPRGRPAGAVLLVAAFATYHLAALLTAIIPAFYLSPFQ
ncbi:MAG TPA: DUF2142 domain-containing protein [Dehalococcoidia bacterium]|nr:DUF2142 domain-containing protein [Dehalococcoidia bacterium]